MSEGVQYMGQDGYQTQRSRPAHGYQFDQGGAPAGPANFPYDPTQLHSQFPEFPRAPRPSRTPLERRLLVSTFVAVGLLVVGIIVASIAWMNVSQRNADLENAVKSAGDALSQSQSALSQSQQDAEQYGGCAKSAVHLMKLTADDSTSDSAWNEAFSQFSDACQSISA